MLDFGWLVRPSKWLCACVTELPWLIRRSENSTERQEVIHWSGNFVSWKAKAFVVYLIMSFRVLHYRSAYTAVNGRAMEHDGLDGLCKQTGAIHFNEPLQTLLFRNWKVAGNHNLNSRSLERDGVFYDDIWTAYRYQWVPVTTWAAVTTSVPLTTACTRPQLVGLQIWRVATNILNNQSRTAERGVSPVWGLGEMLAIHHRKNLRWCETYHKASCLDWFFGTTDSGRCIQGFGGETWGKETTWKT